MTVTTTANSILYAGNGTTTAFAFPYIFFAPTDLVVTLVVTATGVAVTPPPVLNGAATYDYTVTGVVTHGEYASGGTVTFNTAPLAGYTVSLVRAVPALQTVTLIDNTKFPADTVNTEFDYLTVLAQQALASADWGATALQIPRNEAGLVVMAVPALARANKLLLWDGAGNLTTLDPVNIIGGAVPAGPAGGDLAATYPNPTIKASVALAGNPTTTTVTPSTDSTTKIATTAFVQSRLAAGAPGMLTLYQEVVLSANASEMRVNIVAGAKKIEIEFLTLNAGGVNDVIAMRALVGSTPNTSAGYHTQTIYASGTGTAAASQSLSATFWSFSNAASAKINMRPVVTASQSYSEAAGWVSTSTQMFAMNYSHHGPASAGMTGVQLFNASATQFGPGSFLRVYVVV